MQRVFLLIAYFLFCVICFAQQYPFVHYTPKDGLVNSRVRKAYQDGKGKMYFITFGGLSVYDGARFKNYTTQNGLLVDLVNDVLEVGDDSLLVATNTCGLNVLVRGEMKNFYPAKKNCPVVNQLLKSRDGNVYASTDDGLYRLGKTNFEKLSDFFPQQKEPVTFLGNLTEYKDFIVFTRNDLRNYTGLFLYNKRTDKITDVIPHLYVRGLKSDRSGIVWVSSPATMHNLDTIALSAGKLELRKPYAVFVNQEAIANGNMNFNQQNEPLIVSDTKGIVRYNKDGTQLLITCSELSSVAMQNFFIDRENILWICHDGNGVYKLSDTKLQSTNTFFLNNNSGIRFARAFIPFSVWMVMNNRQWILNTPSGNKRFSINPGIDAIPLHYSKTHVYATSFNQLYSAVMPTGNERTLQFKKIMVLPDTTNFGAIAVADPYGNIIAFENGNICVIQNEKRLFNYPFSTLDLIQGMYVDKKNLLWVISRGGGLMILSIRPDDPSHYLQKEFHFIKEFEGASPRCMVIDKNEILWVGTRYNGLMAFEYKNNQLQKLHHFRTQNGLTDNFVTSLACDGNDNIIIGTQTGLDRLIKTKDTSYRLENITKSNNIFAYINYVWTDVNNSAFALTNAGTVFRVEPVLSAKAVAEPQLLIESMKVNGKALARVASPLQLDFDQRNISFSIAAPTFIDEKQVQYSYLLSGNGNNEWSDTTAIADINLLNLAPGDYKLRVKAFFPSTSYSPKETVFAFQILPPWWQTVLFKLIAASMISILLIMVVRFYYNNKLRRQRVILEKKQAIQKERTRIATDMHDDLGAGLSRIKFLSETIGIKKLKQEPIENDITSIRQYSHEMIDKMGEIVWALNERNDSLSDLLAYTRSYTVEYLSQNGILCIVEAPDEFPSTFVSGEFRRNIFLVVKEALHNVVKHAEANTVFLQFNIRNGLHIIIGDDGRGFNMKNLKPYSNGLTNMNKRMKDIGGSFEIESNNGTIIKLSAPLPS